MAGLTSAATGAEAAVKGEASGCGEEGGGGRLYGWCGVVS